jgi:Protein of unknown function (DUF3987)
VGDAWDEIVAKSGLAPSKPSYGATNGHAKPVASFTANLSNPRVAGALRAALESARDNIISGQTTGLGRNNQLNAEAANLYSLAVANNLMPEHELKDWLYDVAREAGLEHDENCGPKQIDDTIASGFKAGKHKYGPRNLSHLKDTINLEFVDDIPDHPTEAPATNWKPVKLYTPCTDFDSIFEGDDEFWGARQSLQHIYTAALSRLAPPWGVLANVAARILTTVRPNATLPPLIGDKGSLNWFAAVAAESGGGKGASSACGAALITDQIDVRNLGSGEGICQQFWKPGKGRDAPPIVHEAIMFEATEIDAMTSLRERSGQTTMSVLRNGFSAETLGFSYRNNDHHIDAHTYRMTLVLSLQPGRARPLLEDADGGTPQRFQWFPGRDSRISEDSPWWPGPLTIPDAWEEWKYPRDLTVPKIVEETVKRERVKGQRGDQHALDGHALFVREKFAFALALIDNRTEMTEEDWELSGIAAEVSTRTREWVTHRLETAEDEAAEATGRTYGIRAAASNAAKDAFAANRVFAVQQLVLKRLRENGPTATRDLRHSLNSKNGNRTWLQAALKAATEAGLIERGPDGRWRAS